MGSTCTGGEFDGTVLTSDRDRALCEAGGGSVATTEDRGVGSAAARIKGFAAASGHRVRTQGLYDLRALFGIGRDVGLLERVNAAAEPVVESLLGDDAEATERLVGSLEQAEAVAARLAGAPTDEVALSEQEFTSLAETARLVAERSGEEDLDELVGRVLDRVREYVGLPASEVARRLTPDLDTRDLPSGKVDVEVFVPVTDAPSPELFLRHRLDVAGPWSGLRIDSRWLVAPPEAVEAIEAKAREVRDLAGAARSRERPVPGVEGAYSREYQGCTIYWSKATGAHEVHGEIRAKYDAVNGPARLGVPTTDETATPDGRGHFNHFSRNASIYWTPTTGPFWIAGAVRFRYASLGWERSALGYPIQDQQVLPGLYPGDDVDIEWIRCENGVIGADHGDAQVARAATVTPQQLTDGFFRMVDRRLTSRSYGVGLVTVTARPGLHGVDVIGVEPGTYGFWGTGPRTLHLRVRGFVSLPVVPDPTWEADLYLQFSLRWQPQLFSFPGAKDLVARLSRYRVHVDGVFSETIASAIVDALSGVFGASPDGSIRLTSIPTGVRQRGRGNLDVLDAMLLGEGGLGIFVNPVPEIVGKFRQVLGQKAIDTAVENL